MDQGSDLFADSVISRLVSIPTSGVAVDAK
jgi:hypothetical protein